MIAVKTAKKKTKTKVKLTNCIGHDYYEMYHHIKNDRYMHYLMKGGRGSLKSAFACIMTIYLMTKDFKEGRTTHAVALRKVHNTIPDSIYSTLMWAIDLLQVGHLWHTTKSPLKIWCGENTILFRGCANQEDHKKIKSIKFKKGYCKYALFEELCEFNGMDEVNSINQSLFRGTDEAIAFYMYNPPASKNNWVNKEAKKKVKNRFVHHSTYLEVEKYNPEWLGTVFIKEAKNTKENNPRGYKHMYLGEEIGEGIEIYPPLTIDNPEGLVEYRTITNEEIKDCVKLDRGFDFGATHASCYSGVYYNKEKDWIYVVEEVYLYGASNNLLASSVYNKCGSSYIIGDSANKNLISELNMLGLNIGKCKKGPDSLTHGIMWLRGRARIIIDKKRTPNIANDFESYEFKKDKEGNIIHDFHEMHEPDGCASVRYALQKYILNHKLKFGVIRL